MFYNVFRLFALYLHDFIILSDLILYIYLGLDYVFAIMELTLMIFLHCLYIDY